MSDLEELEVLESLERNDDIDEEKNVVVKVKKPRTQKQIDAFAKVQLIRQENRDLRKKTKISLEEENKIILDKMIVAKAIALKKKQIKMEKMLVIAEDDDDMVIERKVEKPKKVVHHEPEVQQEKPKSLFKFV
jgi:hypothetical protein